MNTQRPKDGTRYRVCVDFPSVEEAVTWIGDLDARGAFGDRSVGARLADSLDDRQVREVLVRSESDVRMHPGALLPLPIKSPDESATQYRERLNHEQKAIFDARAAALAVVTPFERHAGLDDDGPEAA